jgi:hypothetical protein
VFRGSDPSRLERPINCLTTADGFLAVIERDSSSRVVGGLCDS